MAEPELHIPEVEHAYPGAEAAQQEATDEIAASMPNASLGAAVAESAQLQQAGGGQRAEQQLNLGAMSFNEVFALGPERVRQWMEQRYGIKVDSNEVVPAAHTEEVTADAQQPGI